MGEKKFIEDTITDKAVSLLCRFNLLCRIAIALGFDGLCTYDFPCLMYTLGDVNSTKFIRTNPVRLKK